MTYLPMELHLSLNPTFSSQRLIPLPQPPPYPTFHPAAVFLPPNWVAFSCPMANHYSVKDWCRSRRSENHRQTQAEILCCNRDNTGHQNHKYMTYQKTFSTHSNPHTLPHHHIPPQHRQRTPVTPKTKLPYPLAV